jgi:hypothetical protein
VPSSSAALRFTSEIQIMHVRWPFATAPKKNFNVPRRGGRYQTVAWWEGAGQTCSSDPTVALALKSDCSHSCRCRLWERRQHCHASAPAARGKPKCFSALLRACGVVQWKLERPSTTSAISLYLTLPSETFFTSFPPPLLRTLYEYTHPHYIFPCAMLSRASICQAK